MNFAEFKRNENTPTKEKRTEKRFWQIVNNISSIIKDDSIAVEYTEESSTNWSRVDLFRDGDKWITLVFQFYEDSDVVGGIGFIEHPGTYKFKLELVGEYDSVWGERLGRLFTLTFPIAPAIETVRDARMFKRYILQYSKNIRIKPKIKNQNE